MASRFSPEERTQQLAALPGWRHDAERDAISRQFVFADFVQAFGFMTQLALVAERLNHHPEWRNVWNRVDIVLTTHDADGLSPLDIELARQAETLAAQLVEARA
jgi:4a-hydroxytetrahydrobiopterin dehydratase